MSVDWIKDEAIDNVHGLRDYMEKKKKKKKKDEDIAPINDAPSWIKESALEDIAPVTKTETQTEEKSGLFDGYFQKGAFEDGYQFGDIAKTLIATDADIATSLPAKVLDWGENALDAGAVGIAKLAGKLGKEDTRDKLIDFAKKDLYDGKDVARKILNSKFARGGGVLGALNAITSFDNMLNSEKVINEDGKEVKVLQDHSVLDDKADSLIASAGETLVKMGISAATGVPAITDALTGVTVFGAKTENSLREGANIDQATGSALISAGAEIIGEKLGGISFGGKTLSDGLSRLLSEKVSNVALRTVLNGATDIGFESLEEVFTEFVDKLGTKLYKEEKLGEILFSDEALQDYADAALAGGLLGGSFSGVNAIKSSVDGTDYKTGLTENENKVVNKEVENRIAEKEAKGEKVTTKVKNEIYKEVMEDLTKGYISTDTIESVLDGESYEAYKNLRDNETRLNEKVDSLSQEIETLLDKENPTIRDNERLAEARKELETAKSDLEKIGGHINEHITYTRHNMNERLQGERKGKGSYLSESYNEIGRLNERYVADFSKYEGTKHEDAARKTIENAMNRGANNTNRVHDIVELGASLSADTGIVFDWAGNEDIKKDFIKQQKSEIEKLEKMTELSEEDATKLSELKEMLRKVEAGEVTVNGNITDNGIVINLDSKKALQSIVGHEITHSLEKSAAYKALKDAIFAYAKAKGFDVDAEIEAKTKTYKGVNKAKPEYELVADLVGDYIFNDYDFVLNLATNNKNTFQKLWDDVKYLCKIATTGSKEARDLARAKHNFERAYKEATKASDTAKKSENYSLSIDNSQNLVYNGKRGDGYARTDEFRRLQEESRGMSAEEWNFYLRGGKNEVVRRRVTTILQRQMDSFRRSGGFNNGLLTFQGKENQFNIYEDVEPSLFHDVFEVTRKYLTNGELVDLHDIETTKDHGIGYKYCKNYLSEDGLSGFSITPDGDLISVFNASGKSGFLRAIAPFVKENAKTLDCYASPNQNLLEMYQRAFGFKTASLMDYNMKYDHDNIAKNHGEPKIAFMVNTDADVETRTFTKEQYDEAVTYRNGFFAPENAEPTSDPDIRFSLSEAVEETKDLIAVHNLKSNELLKSFELGGLPMPSIAVVKADAAHDQYGEISLILPKESIDPQASRDNKVYGGDAWTPTYPKIEYKANEAVAQKISDKYYELYSKYGSDEVRSLYNYTYDMDETLTRHGGEASMLEDLYDSTGIMQVYLLDTGKGKVETVRKEIRTELSDAEVEMNEFFIKELGADVVDGVMNLGILSPSEHRIKYWGEHGEKIKEAYHKFLSEEYGFSQEEIENVLASMKTYDYMKIVRDAHLYRKNGRVTTKTEADHKATEEAIREAAGEGYKDWINGLFKGIEEKTGIRNNKEYFTPSGNRRGWEALHWENTLENVVRVMRQQNQTGADAIFGAHQIFAVAAKEYGSIDEIKADSDRLYKMSEEEYESVKESYSQRMLDIANRIMDKGERNQFIAIDNAMECIVDAVRNSKTKAGIYKELSQYTQLNVTERDVADIVSLVNDISNMPTGYFEAKPMRAVGFDEVGVFVIPRNADVKLKQELLSRGYAIAEYDPDVEGDRQKVVNSFEEYKFSLSDAGEQLAPFGRRGTYGKDFLVRGDNVLAPVKEAVTEKATTTERAARSDLPISDIDYAPIVDERSRLEARVESLQAEMDSLLAEAKSLGDQFNKGEITEDEHETRVFGEIRPRYNELADERLSVEKQLKALDENETAEQGERLDSFTDADAPPEVEAPYYGDNEAVTPEDPFYDRDIKEVGNRKVKAYMYENPEVKPFFQEAAEWLLSDLRNTTRGERFYTEVDWSSKGVWSGVQRQTSPDIAYLLDNLHYTYKQIEDGLNAIIEDNGKENNACSKKIEFLLNDRLLKGFEDINGMEIPPNQDYINLLNEKQIKEYNEEARQKFFEAADEYAPPQEGAEPTIEAPLAPMEAEAVTQPTEDIAPIPDMSNAGRNVAQGKRSMFSEKQEKRRVARALTEEPQAPKKKARLLSTIRTNVLDKQSVFEDLALKTKNRELMGKANYMLSSESRAQWFIGHGNNRVKALTDIREEVESSGKLGQFYDYMYHVHNIDRMSLETDENRAKRMAVRQQFQGFSDKQIQSIALTWITKDTTAEEEARIRAAREYVELSKNKNKPVFGYSETADVSREKVKKFEAENPEFKAWAQDVYDYNKYLRKMLVDGNVISQETADLWEKIYPHFVPIRREGHDGSAVNVPLDSRKTGVNAPIKRATGGNADILPLFDTMALRTEQTFKAVAKNQFGLELMHTLDSAIDADEANGSAASVDDILESMETQDELLQKGKDGMSPTFTVFENGKRVTFEITEDMYEALEPTSKALSLTIKPLNVANNIRRGLITEYNPVFLATNALKDAQDVLINSQHPAKTYANLPKAYWELAKKGKWYTEYMAAGGEQNTFFDGENKTFNKEDEGFKKLIGMPLRAISAANNFFERAPRLAEYIASRESGASIETSMLDAARVTTNFAAGGDVTKLLNRNGFTFLNASVQGFNQQIRNIREAKQNGFKGWAQLAAKTMIAGIPALLLNGLLWDDDEDYEELSDYVKDNYYIVAKYGDGQFVRIPKGRMVAVIQDAFEQIGNVATGKEADWGNLWDLAKTNIAPTNLADNNIIAPIKQALTNKTWYGEDLVPTRLQDLPAAEQFDESTDSISKWLGEKTNTSPIKWNYLLDQYSGAVGDVFLPMMTPEAESGDNSIAGNLLAPWKDKFSTDSVMNNQNVSDFYDTVDELAKNANSSRATDEDILKSKYMNSVNSELSALYKEKREIQNSDLADDEKYAAVREIQEEIVKIAKNGLRDYKHVAIDDGYARVGDRYYRMDDEGKWVKLTDKQIAQQQEVVSGLGIDPSAYWQDKSEYDFAYEYPEKYAVARSVGGYDAYKAYSSELYDIKADKDENGKSITGSRKEKVIAWINEQEDLEYGEAIILFKSEYPADDTYNYDIIDYLNGRDDISYEDMETILKELGFNVDKEGNITWD